MAAVPPLAGHPALRRRARQRHDAPSRSVLRGIVLRSAVGLPGAGVGADEETGAKLAELVDGVNGALALLRGRGAHARAGARRCAASPTATGCPGTLAGRATRLLHDAGETRPAPPRCPARSRRARTPERGASWIEGFIGTSGLVLVHDPDLLAILDGWIARVAAGRLHQRPARCCAARSPSSPPASAAASASASANLKGTGPFTMRVIDAERRAAGAGDRREAAGEPKAVS